MSKADIILVILRTFVVILSSIVSVISLIKGNYTIASIWIFISFIYIYLLFSTIEQTKKDTDK